MAILFSSRSLYYTKHCTNVPVTHGPARLDDYGPVIPLDTLTDYGFTLHYHYSDYLYCTRGFVSFSFVESTPVPGPLSCLLVTRPSRLLSARYTFTRCTPHIDSPTISLIRVPTLHEFQ